MTSLRCSGRNRAGNPCAAHPQRDRPWCIRHDPELEEQRAEWQVLAGKSSSNAARAAKRMPADLRDTLSTLYRTLAKLEMGEIEPSKATAIATVSRAIVTVWDMGEAERRISELERVLQERVE